MYFAFVGGLFTNLTEEIGVGVFGAVQQRISYPNSLFTWLPKVRMLH